MIPGSATPFLLAKSDGEYKIERSLRFDIGASSKLTRTPSSAGNRRTWTLSFWIKRSKIGDEQMIFSAAENSGNRLHVYFPNEDYIAVYSDPPQTGVGQWYMSTSTVARDPSAWMHLVFACDTTQSTATDRFKIYVNGALATDFTNRVDPPQYHETPVNSAILHQFSGRAYNTADHFDGYLAEVHFIDGQALSASNFGKYDNNNVWQPKKFNHVTEKHIGDWVGDTTGTPYGGAVNGSDKAFDGDDSTGSAANTGTAFVFTPSTPITGISKVRIRAARDANMSDDDGLELNGTAIGSNWTAGSAVSEVEITVNNLTSLRWETNNVSHWFKVHKIEIYYGGAYHTLVQGGINSFHLDFSDNSSNAALGNDKAGSNNWTVNNLTAIAGFETANQGFDVATYTGTGGSQSISSLLFQPDLVWVKALTDAQQHVLFDVVRGVSKRLMSDATSGEVNDTSTLTSFDSNGFTAGGGWETGKSGIDYLAWCWKAGGAASSNSDGSQTSSVSANTTYGFSVVTGTQSANNTTNTYGHGLGAEPKMIILKRTNGSEDWYVYHKELGNTSRVQLNSNAAVTTGSGVWGSTTPTSSVFTIQSFNAGDFVAYCWSEVSGFSKFGKYTGDSPSGQTNTVTVTTGFKPKFILIKRVGNGSDGDTSYGGWGMYTSTTTNQVMANCSAAEGIRGNCSGTSNLRTSVSFNDDGFSVSTPWYELNDHNVEYIYAAFADKPNGSAIDSLIDTPTNYEATPNNAGNYCTLNPLQSATTLTNGNLDSAGGSGWSGTAGTFGMSSGKWYFEYDNVVSNEHLVGVVPSTTYTLNTTTSYAYGSETGGKYSPTGGSNQSYGSAWTTGDVIGIAFDADNGDLYFYKNGTIQNSGTAAFSGLTSGPYVPSVVQNGSSRTASLNFGQRPFAYTPPTGYVSLCTQNLPDPTIANGLTAFDVVLYSGTGSSQTVGSLNFSPDLAWMKQRSGTRDHMIHDTVRGDNKALYPSQNYAEASTSGVTFGSTGFTLGTDAHVNESSNTYVAWAWDAGSSNTTISAGGLNSLFYNQSQTWSSGTFFNDNGNAFYNSGGSAAQLFDNVESGPGSNGDFPLPVNGGTFTLTFSQFSSATTVELEVEGTGNALKINGSFVTIPSGSPATATYSVSGLTTIEWLYNGGSNYCYLGSIKVDGVKLVNNGTSVTNVPTIASTVRANPTAGFSIVSYSSASNSVTVGHGLNAAPEFIILKDRNNSYDWVVITTLLANTTDYLVLNSTAASANFGVDVPTSTTFIPSQSANSDYIAYCFAPVEGFSAFGKFSGNSNTDGPFQYCGFKPRFLLLKGITQARDWIILDTARDSGNVGDSYLHPNSNGAENTYAIADILSNGFKMRYSGGLANQTGEEYVWAAFASNPFKTARAR